MLKRPNSILIGKDISRTATLTGFPGSSSNNLAAGEVIVLDKNRQILAAGSTIADTDTIYIAQATSNTFNYTDPQGTSVTSVPEVMYSEPIVGSKVTSFLGRSYAASSEQAMVFTLTSNTVTVGTEYILRIVYNDTYVSNRPGQFTQTYRIIATDSTIDTLGAAMAAKVNAHSGTRVTAAYSASPNTLTITGKAIADCTTSLTDIDKYEQVQFDAVMLYVDTNGYWQTWEAAGSNTVASKGYGTWELLRDAEKAALGYAGPTNRTHFPVISPDAGTVKDETYDQIIIESGIPYKSPDNSYSKDTFITTEIFIPNNAVEGANQKDEVLAVLNPWMESAGLTSITV